MEAPAKLNISEVIDHSKLGPFQIGIFILCGLCLIMDGFDVQAMGYVAPAIIREWKIPNPALGPVFGAGLFGVLIGSLLFSMLADKIGRRPVLIGATLFFSALTLLTTQARSIEQMLAIRFVAGLGLGGIMPNAVALCGEYSSRVTRVTVMTIIGNGFTAGAAIGGFISAWLIPNFGWRSVFYFGATIPLVIAVVMFFWLPESLQFLVLRGKDLKRVDQWLKRVDPAAASRGAAVQYVVPEQRQKGVPVVQLFREGRAVGTIQLWTVNFMNLLNLYFLSSWLPTVVRDTGFSTSIAVLAGATVQVGGTVAGLGLGWFIQRFGFVPVLTTCFAVASVNIAMIGHPGSLVLLFTVVFLAGMGVVGGQAAVNALAATFYPTTLRSTGIGWGLGIGRIGAVVGPVLAGEMMALHWTTERLFLAAAVPALISAIVMLGIKPSRDGRAAVT